MTKIKLRSLAFAVCIPHTLYIRSCYKFASSHVSLSRSYICRHTRTLWLALTGWGVDSRIIVYRCSATIVDRRASSSAPTVPIIYAMCKAPFVTIIVAWVPRSWKEGTDHKTLYIIRVWKFSARASFSVSSDGDQRRLSTFSHKPDLNVVSN